MFCSVPSQRGISLSFLYSIVKEITETASSALFLDIYLKFDTNGKRSTRLNDKRHGFHFAIVNVLHLDMEFMLHNSYVTLELAFNIHTFFIVTEFWKLILLNQGFSKNLLILPFQKNWKMSAHCWKVSCQLRTDAERCEWLLCSAHSSIGCYIAEKIFELTNFRSDDFNFIKRNPWFSSFLVSSIPLSKKSW